VHVPDAERDRRRAGRAARHERQWKYRVGRPVDEDVRPLDVDPVERGGGRIRVRLAYLEPRLLEAMTFSAFAGSGDAVLTSER
jgi:hypothetical protein